MPDSLHCRSWLSPSYPGRAGARPLHASLWHMAAGDAPERRLSLPWFLPVICFIPLLIAAPLWHRAPAAEPVMPDVEHLTTDGYLKGPSKPGPSKLGPSKPGPSKPVVEQPAPRPVRRQQLHTSSPATRKHNATRHTRDAVSK